MARTVVDRADSCFRDGQDWNPFVVFRDVPEQELDSVLSAANAEESIITKLGFDYYRPFEVLVVKLRSKEQEQAVQLFTRMLYRKLGQMHQNTSKHLRSSGPEVMKTKDRVKVPDACFSPVVNVSEDRQGNYWPTLVIEVGFSQCHGRLDQDAKWWLQQSEGHVRMVLTVSIERQGCEGIKIEKWVPSNCKESHHDHRYDSNGGLVKAPSITICRGQNGKVAMMNGEEQLVIPFTQVLHREPQENDRDIVFEREDLENLAKCCIRKV